jgi:hypothetical protein
MTNHVQVRKQRPTLRQLAQVVKAKRGEYGNHHSNFGMFSPLGDEKVHHVVQTAVGALLEIGKDHPEVFDTMVRENICDAIEEQLCATPKQRKS